MTRGVDVAAIFARRHPGMLNSALIQELADLINSAQQEAYELGQQNMIDEISATVIQVTRKRRFDNV